MKQVEQTRSLSTLEYRDWFKQSQIPRAYMPWLHVSFNFLTLLTLVLINFWSIQSWNIYIFLILALMFLLGNFVVWSVHRYPLHRRYRLWSYPYDTHTVSHHRYFTAEAITYEEPKDLFAVFFPTAVIAAFALIGQPAFYFVAKFLFNKDLGHAIAGSAALYFLCYEVFHWASHLPEDHWVIRMPWFRYMRLHHIQHHNPKLMRHYNFCIVFPLMDILMGTKYRGPELKENIDDHYQDVKNNFELSTK
jgi:hypothetical protein